MTTKTMNHGDLAANIEHLVREYISTIRSEAQGAVERAVAAAVSGNAGARVKKQGGPSPAPSRRPGKRRASDEIVTLGERFYDALCRSPGETMTVLAPIVGATARELNRSTLVLKRAGRIRTVGTRQATRYFPMTPRSST
jgi:hypothetical protein